MDLANKQWITALPSMTSEVANAFGTIALRLLEEHLKNAAADGEIKHTIVEDAILKRIDIPTRADGLLPPVTPVFAGPHDSFDTVQVSRARLIKKHKDGTTKYYTLAFVYPYPNHGRVQMEEEYKVSCKPIHHFVFVCALTRFPGGLVVECVSAACCENTEE